MDNLIESGGQGASSVADAVREAEVIITIVPDSPDVQDVALGEDGIYANAKQGAIHVDMSSIRPDVSVELAEAGEEPGSVSLMLRSAAGKPAPGRPSCRSWSVPNPPTSTR